MNNKIYLIFFLLFNSLLFSEIHLECKNPEKLGYKKDFYLLKIYEDFKSGSYQEKGKVDVIRIVHFKNPNLIGIQEYNSIEILRGESKYSIMSERKFEPYDDFWQIYRSNLKLEITRSSPYQEFDGKCKVINDMKFDKTIQKFYADQKKLEDKYNKNKKI